MPKILCWEGIFPKHSSRKHFLYCGEKFGLLQVAMLHEETTKAIIGAAISVLNELKPGLTKSFMKKPW